MLLADREAAQRAWGTQPSVVAFLKQPFHHNLCRIGGTRLGEAVAATLGSEWERLQDAIVQSSARCMAAFLCGMAVAKIEQPELTTVSAKGMESEKHVLATLSALGLRVALGDKGERSFARAAQVAQMAQSPGSPSGGPP